MSFVTSFLPSSAAFDLSLSSLKRFLPFATDAPSPRPAKARRTAENITAPLARTPSVVLLAHVPHNSMHNSSSPKRRVSSGSKSGVNKQTTRVAHSHGQERRKAAPLRRHETFIMPSPHPAPPALSGASTIFASPTPPSLTPTSVATPTSPSTRTRTFTPAFGSASRPHPLLRRTLASPGPRPAHLARPRSPIPTAENPYPIIKPRRTRPFVPLCSPLAPERVHFPRPEYPRMDLHKKAVWRRMSESEAGQLILKFGAHQGVMKLTARDARLRAAEENLRHYHTPHASATRSVDVEMADVQENSPMPSPGSSTSGVDVRSGPSNASTSSSSPNNEDWEMLDA